MKLRLTSYSITLLLLGAVSIFTTDLLFGLAYLIAILPSILMIFYVKNKRIFIQAPVLIAILAIFAFYLIRPIFLAHNPEYFGYPHLGIPNTELYAKALLNIGLMSSGFLLGLCGVLVLFTKKYKLSGVSRPGTIAKLSLFYLFILLSLTICWAALMLGFNVGVKKSNSSLEVFKLILPLGILMPAALGYLAASRYRAYTFFEKLIVVTIIVSSITLLLISGSKSGTFLLVLYLVAYVFCVYGDIKFGVMRGFTIGIVSPVLLIASFMVANLIKYYGISGLENIPEWISGISNFTSFVLDRVTYRLNGFDGMVAVLLEQPEGLEPYMNWFNHVKTAIEKLIPGVGDRGFSVGKAVGIFYNEKAIDDNHAGAIGMFGALYFMHSAIGGFFVSIIIGCFFGLAFNWIERVSVGYEERITFILIICFQMAITLSSGNFDSSIQRFLLSFIHILFYYFILRILLTVIPKRNDSKNLGLAGR